MKSTRLFLLIFATMIAFAGNSLLCRLALRQTGIDPASFTLTRIFSGAAVLWFILKLRGGAVRNAGHWLSALALFAYAAAFSFAYISLSAGTGALLLFGAVQATMILWGVSKGERLGPRQLVGLVLALGGLVALVSPGLSAPPPGGAALMLAAGIAWGVYSLRGKGSGKPVAATAGNFVRAVPMAALLSLVFLRSMRLDPAGIGYALLSGMVASGLGYVLWYSALPHLRAANAATVQLSVPVLAALGGVLLLGEPVTIRFLVSAVAVLAGIALVILSPRKAPLSPSLIE